MGKNQSQAQKPISVPAMVKINYDIYFHESYGNRIFRYSLENEILVCVAKSSFLPGHRLGYMGVTQYKEKIYFFPYYSTKICVYDIRSDAVMYIDCQYQYITKAVNCREKIFFWSDNQNIVVCFDVENETQREIKLPDNMHINGGCIESIEVKGNLYIPAKENGRVICIDTQTLTVQLLAVADEEMIFETIAFDGEDFWLSGTQRKIVKWNPAKAVSEEYFLENLEERKIEIPWDFYFYASIIFKGYIYFAPFKAKQLVRIHIQSSKIEQILEVHENEGTMVLDNWNNYLYFSCKNLKDGMALMDCLIDGNGYIGREKILFAEPDFNLAIQEHNGDSLRNFINQIKGEHNEENYFK